MPKEVILRGLYCLPEVEYGKVDRDKVIVIDNGKLQFAVAREFVKGRGSYFILQLGAVQNLTG